MDCINKTEGHVSRVSEVTRTIREMIERDGWNRNNFKKTTVRRSISSTHKFSSNLDCANMANQWVSNAPFFSYNVSWSVSNTRSCRSSHCEWAHEYQQVHFNRCSAYEWFCGPKLPWFSVCLTTEFYRPRRTIPKMPTKTSHFSCKFYKHFGGLADLKTLKVNSCFHLSPHVRCAVLRRDGL